MRRKRWSLAGRMTRLFVGSTTLLVLAISLSSYVALERSVNSEIDALTESRIKAFKVAYERRMAEAREKSAAAPAGSGAPAVADRDVLRAIAAELREQQGFPVAWRVWNVGWPKVYAEMGDVSLLAPDYPELSVVQETRRLPAGVRWRTELLDRNLRLGVVVDGGKHMELLRRYQWFAGVLIIASTLLALLLGAILIERVSRMLRKVAENARAVRAPEEPVRFEVEDAPDEIREVAEALRELLDNIRAENERSRVLLASMAHELRSPIQNLVGETEVILFSQRQAADYRRVLESNLEELRDLGDAIDNLVTICADRRGGDQRQKEDFDLHDEARIRLQRERATAARRGIDLHLEARGDTRMRGDREAILRALRNLAANAIEWSEPGDRVDVRLEGREEVIVLTVDDAGPGIPPPMRAQVFDPFVRGPAAKGRRIGYGLGLAIVRAAVDGQGGSIEIAESPAGGTRFAVHLPRALPSPSEEPQPEPASA